MREKRSLSKDLRSLRDSSYEEIHMSRYPIAAYDPKYIVVVGWDAPMTTFFAQVEDLTINDEENDPIVFWIGDKDMAIPTISQLESEIAPYATISTEIIEQLQADYEQAWAPSPTQQFARQIAALEPLNTKLIGQAVWCVCELSQGQWNPNGTRSKGKILRVARCLNPKYQVVMIDSEAFEKPKPFTLDSRGLLWDFS